MPDITPEDFIAKWKASSLKERSAAQEDFCDLCRLLDEPTPAQADPDGSFFCFERGATKTTGSEGWADIWKRSQSCSGDATPAPVSRLGALVHPLPGCWLTGS